MGRKRRIHWSPFRTIILGFAGVIALGTLLLMLPAASRDSGSAPFQDALFTATSAVCVTGLVVRDTASYWTGFGQALILTLIQIGGLGVVTVTAFFAMISGRRIGIIQRNTMQEALGAQRINGIVRLTSFILKVTLLIEGTGALLMLPSFMKRDGLAGIWEAVFHSVSAFCNAGFDVTGRSTGTFTSLTSYAADPLVSLTVTMLIVIGGIGFLTWEDVRMCGWKIRQYRMQSKVILVMTAWLITIPALWFFFAEFRDLPVGQRILVSLFQSVTPRTAGFNTMPLGSMSGVGKMLMIMLMLIGGSPGSTAGGMKTTTVAVLFANARAVFGRSRSVKLFDRRIEESVVRQAATIAMIDIVFVLAGAGVISVTEGLPLGSCLYEAASAMGTVGLSLGITPSLHTIARCTLMLLMFFGRVGGLTIIYAAISTTDKKAARLPIERITTG